MESLVEKANIDKGFSIVDYIIFAASVSVSLSIGLYYAFTGGKQRTAGEFLMGNRRLSTLPIALSILVSYVSSILVLGTPAEMYTRGTQLVLRTVGYCLACIVSSLLFVPMFYSLNVTSSFEYLEMRFNSKVIRLFGTIMMLLGNLLYMGLVMYSPSTALQAATGFPLYASVVITGVIATVYTTLGGMKAVVWTDAFQALVMMGGMLAIVIQGCILVGGISRVWEISLKGDRIQFFNFDPDPTQRLTFWSTVVGGMFHTLIAFGVGQTSVQRYCSLPTLKKAQRSVFLNIPGLLIVNVLACLVGLVVYAYYADKQCDPLKMKYISNSNQLVPYFVVDVLNIPGIPGIFLAVLFSGALSSISSSLNAASAVTWEDMLKPFYNDLNEAKKAIILKILVICYGVAAVMISFLADGLGGHVLWASISFAGATSGPSLGVFLLGSLFPWANAWGAISGFITSTAFILWIAVGAFFHRPHSVTLPTSTAGCLHGNTTLNGSYYGDDWMSSAVNLTTDAGSSVMLSAEALSVDSSPGGVERMYGLSFLWYSAVGAGITVLIGLLVSLVTGFQDPEKLDANLVVPVFDRLCCCLPARWRHTLRCGVQPIKVTPNDSLDSKESTQSPEEQNEFEFSSKTPLNCALIEPKELLTSESERL